MVLVRVREHDDVQRRSQGGTSPSSSSSSRSGSGPPSTSIRAPSSPLDQDRVALPDVEDHDPGVPRPAPSGERERARTRATAAARAPRRSTGVKGRTPAPAAACTSWCRRAGACRPRPSPARAASPSGAGPPIPRRSRPRRRRRPRRPRRRRAGPTVANGSPAAIRTTPHDVEDEPRGRPARAPSNVVLRGDRASRRSSRPRRAAIAGGTSGTTRRFTTGATSASRPNVSQHVRERRRLRRRARRPGSPRASRGSARRPLAQPAPSCVAHASRPAVASDESRNPASPTAPDRRGAGRRRAARHGRGAAGPPGLAGEQHGACHDGRSHDRRRRAGHDDVGDDRAPTTWPRPRRGVARGGRRPRRRRWRCSSRRWRRRDSRRRW